jgi:Brp/Blh family beta-carotene 15,15'-monooxygenase
MVVAAVAGAVAGPEWSRSAAPLPWLISLVFVGLPHGAADFAVSRTICRGRMLALVWTGYAAAMAAVAALFVAAPLLSIAAFAALSCWHFGAAAGESESPKPHAAPDTLMAGVVSRGCGVLALPLAAWPAATAAAATDLVALAVGPHAAAGMVPEAAVRSAGLALVFLTVLAAAIEGMAAAGHPPSRRSWRHDVIELAVIGSLGWFTDPLFSVGLVFLVWHAWRQMPPVAASLSGAAPTSWPELGRALVHIHCAALPLLVPAWVLIGAAWWWLAPEHTLRGLAIVSIGGYLVVTPAHELLGAALRRMAGWRSRGFPVLPGGHADDGRGRSISRPAMYLWRMLEIKV